MTGTDTTRSQHLLRLQEPPQYCSIVYLQKNKFIAVFSVQIPILNGLKSNDSASCVEAYYPLVPCGRATSVITRNMYGTDYQKRFEPDASAFTRVNFLAQRKREEDAITTNRRRRARLIILGAISVGAILALAIFQLKQKQKKNH